MLICGNVYVIYCDYIKPPHDKLCVCFCEIERLFFFINTKPRLPFEAQVPIAKSEHNALTHDSYIDLSKPFSFASEDIPATADRGALPADVLERIVEGLPAAITLPGRYKSLAQANLTA